MLTVLMAWLLLLKSNLMKNLILKQFISYNINAFIKLKEELEQPQIYKYNSLSNILENKKKVKEFIFK